MSFSEKYQNLLEKINERIPIKWLTKPIDKLFPTASLFLFIIIILLILFFVLKPFIFSTVVESTETYVIAIADNNQKLLSNFEFEIKNLTKDTSQKYKTDSKGVFSIELDKYSDYMIVIDKKGYKYKEEILDLSKTRLNFIVDIFELTTIQSKSLQFVSPDGQLIDEKINVTITCQDATYNVDPTTLEVENGTGIFNLPLGCSQFVATAVSNTYTVKNIAITPETGIIHLNEREKIADYGQARITVKSGENPLDNITLRIYSLEDTVNPVMSGQTQFGSRRFSNLEAGEYKVVATDDTLRYQTTSKNFTISKNIEVQVNLDLDAVNTEVNPGDSVVLVVTRDIKVILRDNETNQDVFSEFFPIVNLILDGNQTIDVKSYQESGIMFRIEEGKDYSLTAKAEGYLSQVKTITPNLTEYIIYLEKITESNVSDINVSVVDEDGILVSNATLWIYDANTSYIDTRFLPGITNEKGEMVFTNISKGNYFIKLRKTTIVDSSSSFSHNPPKDSNVSMLINVGQGTINLVIKNINEEIIDFADIRFYDITKEEIGLDQSTAQGTFSKKIKADKTIFLKISKDGYYDYYTEMLPVIKNETTTKEVKLYRTGYTSVPKIEMIGDLYTESFTPINYFVQNSKHYLKFRAIIPTSGNVGLRFLIGEKENVIDDVVYIKAIENSLSNTSYYSDTILTREIQDNSAKIIDTLFSNANTGVYEFTIPVQVLNATRGTAIPIFYSVYTSSPPEPNSLGNQKIYYVDITELCSENFCIKGEFLDIEDGISYNLEQTNNGLVVNKEYKFTYEITNAKSNIFTNNRLSIKNIENTKDTPTQAIDFLNYSLSGSSFNQEPSTIAGEEIKNSIPFFSEYLVSPTINVYDKIEAIINLKPVLLGATRIQNKIISEQSVVYNNTIGINVSQENSFTITYEPENIVPNKSFILKVTAMDKSNDPVTNAIVNVYQKKGTNQLIALNVGQQRTNDFGFASLSLPPLKNAEKIVISVEKSGYFSSPVEITINQNILLLKQDGKEISSTNPFTINVHKTNPRGSEKTLTIVNRTNYPITLNQFKDSGFSFTGANYLNISQLSMFLNSQISNFTIPANSEENIRIELSASSDAVNLTETLYLSGTITGEVKVDNSQSNYPFSIPMSVKVSVGDGIEEDDCLVINGISNPWQTIVGGNDAAYQTFDIFNNCKTKGDVDTSITLKNIRAKIVNEKDMYGSYTLSIDGKTVTLLEGSYTTIFNDLTPGRHTARIEYRAGDKKIGDIKTKIYINAQVETENGLKYVNTSKEIAFTTDIVIRRIQDCIDFYDGSKKINNMFVLPLDKVVGESKELIVKNNCSEYGRFRLEFCEGKKWSGCQEVKYDNMEGIFQNELYFNKGESTQTVGIIKPEVPGAYLIPVKISILSDTGKAIFNLEKRLKVNSQGGRGNLLFMEDPFIEMEVTKDQENKVILSSQAVKLLNKDINLTPWDYAKQKVEGDTGFSKYMTDSNSNNAFEKMLFNSQNNLTNQNGKGADWWNYAAGGGGALASLTVLYGAIGSVAASGSVMAGTMASVLGTIGGNALMPLLFTIPGYGWAIIGALAIGGWMASTWHNDYSFNPYYKVLDVDSIYTTSEFENTKQIVLSENRNQNELINIFDITGQKYFSYLKIVGKTDGKTNKLTSDKLLEIKVPKCDGKQHQVFFEDYSQIINNKHCNSKFDKYEINDNEIIAGVKCYGNKPIRNKINLNFEVYTSCKYDSLNWPEQAGIKPLNFIVDYSSDTNSDYQKLLNGDILYKGISFYPTLDDDNPIQDIAFKKADPVGDFRFAFISKQYPDSPQGDLEIIECFTDSGKSGSTGVNALPKINLDWSWSSNNFNINVCSDGNQYCDATQLSQVIVERMYRFNEILKNKTVVCPKSSSQILDQMMSGVYSLSSLNPDLSNEVPAGYVGLQSVSLSTDENLLKIKIAIENRTGSPKSGTLNVKFGNNSLQSFLVYRSIGVFENCSLPKEYMAGEISGINVLNPNFSTTVPACDEENTAEYILTFGKNENPILGENIKLEIEYNGESTYLQDPSQTYFLTDVNLSMHSSDNSSSCLVPATTALFNGVDYIDMWFNKLQYPENVISEWNIEDIQQLKQTIEFDAYLITDNYNNQFQIDFDKAYGGKMSKGQSSIYSFLSAPSYYQEGIFSKLFRDNTNFFLKYSTTQNGVNILTPGKYKVRLDFIFNNDDWSLTNNSGEIDANVSVVFTYLSGPDSDSVFYRLPFNGAVGLTNNGYSRQNYGVSYVGDEIEITRQGELPLVTQYSSSSNPKKYINVQSNNDFFKINSSYETRGNILTIKEKTQDQIEMVYSPNYPTRVLMVVERKNLLPFTAYYQLIDAQNQQVYGGTSLGIWNGVGDLSYYDFSGEYVSSKFINFYDRQTSPEERIFNSYAIDWDNVARKGIVNLRTILYTPYDSQNRPLQYKLISKSKGDIDIKFVNDLVYTRQSYDKSIAQNNLDDYRINNIKDVFNNVIERNICVVNSDNGKTTEFYWNPKAIYGENNIYDGKGITGIN